MTDINVSPELRYAREKFLLDLAAKNGGKVTPEELLSAVGDSQKLLLNILWIARRSGYITVDQVREGRKIAFWTVTVTGPLPAAPAIIVDPLEAKKGGKSVAAKPAKQPKEKTVKAAKTKVPTVRVPKQKPVSKPATDKTVAEIKAANLALMKKVSEKYKKLDLKIAKETKRTIDFVEKELGSSGEIATSFNIDPAWDSVEGMDIKTLIV